MKDFLSTVSSRTMGGGGHGGDGEESVVETPSAKPKKQNVELFLWEWSFKADLVDRAEGHKLLVTGSRTPYIETWEEDIHCLGCGGLIQ